MKQTVSASVTIGAGGTGQVVLGPVPVGSTWRAGRLSVTCTGAAIPTAKLYAGTVSDGALIDGTYTGSLDSTDLNGEELRESESIIVVWTGATPGAVATANLLVDRS